MAIFEKNAKQSQDVVNLRINIPELPKLGAFWMRNYPTHRNFGELYDDCVNLPEVARERKTLEQVRASRHFWYNETMLPRTTLLDTLLTQNAPGEGASREISLVLRRDWYQVHPARLVRTNPERTYIDAETPVGEIIHGILASDECPGCFDVCTHRGHRIASNRTLADARCWPGREDAPAEEFPISARLMLRPRVSWLPYALYLAAIAAGLAAGYYWLAVKLVPLPR